MRMATILKAEYARQDGPLQEIFLQIQLLDNIIWKNKKTLMMIESMLLMNLALDENIAGYINNVQTSCMLSQVLH